jgi:hypothetical protein
MILSSEVINENNWFFGCREKKTQNCVLLLKEITSQRLNKGSLKKAMIINMKKIVIFILKKNLCFISHSKIKNKSNANKTLKI